MKCIRQVTNILSTLQGVVSVSELILSICLLLVIGLRITLRVRSDSI